MSDRYFVDTNILMYAHDSSAGSKHERAAALIADLWESRSGVVSTQVLQELCVNLQRKVAIPIDTKTIRDLVKDYSAWHVVVNDETSILDALDLQERYQISFWDALIVHSANAAAANLLYSEDLSDGQIYGAVKTVNPLI